MVELNNGILTAKINPIGAELRSIKKDGVEYIWQGNPEIWANACPLMFPICGGLKDDKFVLNGKEYILPKHGFVRNREFTVESTTDTTATFLLSDSEETLKMYPFKFDLRVIYELREDKVDITYKVDNKTDGTMYFSIGSHEAYSTPEGVEAYDVIFPQKETLASYLLDGNLMEDHSVPIIKESNIIALYDKYFTVDALVFKTLKSRSAILRNRTTGKSVKVEFPGCDYFLLWHKYGAGYICLEPWSGLADSVHSDYDITKKEGIISLPEGETYNRTHTITVLGEYND